MKQNKSVAQLLITYTVILLTPVIVVGILMVFHYLHKLEKNFELLNTKTIEAANTQLDKLTANALAIDYQLTLNGTANAFLSRKFESVVERVNALSALRENLQNAMINQEGIAATAIYSRVNDIIIGHDTVYGFPEFHAQYFRDSDISPEDLAKLVNEVKATPVWFATNQYLIYCSGMQVSTYSGSADGLFFAVIQKKSLTDIWTEALETSEASCALVYKEEVSLLQTPDFPWEQYEEFCSFPAKSGRYMIKCCASGSVGTFSYIYIIDHDYFGGNVAPMIRNYIAATLLLILISFLLARREAKTIRHMYSEVLEQNMSLGDQLNAQVEELNRQILHNALQGYDILTPDKQHAYIKSCQIRVLIFRVAGKADQQITLQELTARCFADENIELQYLYEHDIGHTCILGYATRERLLLAVNLLWNTLCQACSEGIYMSLSSEITNLENLAEAYEQAVTTLHYCELQHPNGGVTHYSEISEQEREKVYYPTEKEAQLLRNIRMGMQEKVEDALSRIHEINFHERCLSGSMLKQLLVKMLNTIYVLADSIYSGDSQEYTNLIRMTQNVLLTKNRSTAFRILQDLMLSICEKCSKQKEGQLRKRIITYIGEHFRDPALSLEKMAEDFDMSYHHLSRQFNECMQMNFASYLAGLRLEYSTQLLKTSQLSIEQVAQQAGFLQSGSFIRAFKKYYGVTPGKYRSDH